MPANSLANFGESTALAAVSSGLAGLHIGLYRTVPANGGSAGIELGTSGITAVDYVRMPVAFSSPTPTGGVTTTHSSKNTAEVRFPAAGAGGWGIIEGIGIFDALTGGNLVWYGTLTGGNKIINAGDVIIFEQNQIELTMQ